MFDYEIKKTIRVQHKNLRVGDFIIPLHCKKRTLELVKYLANTSRGASRSELRKHIYGKSQADLANMSERLIECQEMSLSKLISRSRKYLKLSLQGTEWEKTIEWFVYDDIQKIWFLSNLVEHNSPNHMESLRA